MTLEGWHLRREISVTHLVTTVSLLAAGIWWTGKLEARVSAVENRQTEILEVIRVHVAQDMHSGAALALARFEGGIGTSLEGVMIRLGNIDRRLDRQWEELKDIKRGDQNKGAR